MKNIIMKRIFTLFSLCWILVGTAFAQGVAVSALSDEGVYVINWNRTNYGGLNAFKVSSSSATTVTNSKKAGASYSHDSDSDPNYQFAIIKGATEGQYFLYSIAANKFLRNATSSNEISLTASPNTGTDYVTFDQHNTAIGSSGDPCGFNPTTQNIYHIIFGSNSKRINVNGSGEFKLMTAGEASDDPGNVFQIIRVEGASFTGEVAERARQKVNPSTKDYTINYVYNGEILKSEAATANPFTDIPTKTITDYTVGNYTFDDATITQYPYTNERAITLNVTPNFPFWTNKVYKIHPRDNSYLLGATGTAQPSIVAADNFTPGNWWYFVRKNNSLNEFSIHTFYLNQYGIKSTVTSSSTVTKVAPTVASDATKFIIKMVSGSNTQFLIQDPNKDTYYLGGHDGWNGTLGKNTKLTAWNGSGASTDGGSKFSVTELTWDMLNSLQNNMTSDYLFAHINDLDTRTDELTPTNLMTALSNASPNIETGKNYMIYSGYSGLNGRYATADPIANKNGEPQDNNRNLTYSNTAAPLKSIVQFEAVDGETNKYYIKHVNSGMYFGQLTSSGKAALPVSKTNAGKYTPLYETSGDLTLLGLKETTNNMYFHSADGNIVGWGNNSVTSAGSSARIKLCNTIDLTLSTAGWSTFCSPVALTIPATDGLNIYYVSSIQGDAVYVKEITGTIPAKTPVLVNGNVSSTITFAIADNVPAIEGNKLMGTTMRRTGFSTNTNGNPDVFGLKVSDTSASFVPAYSETLPANKAMLPYANIPASNSPVSSTSAFRLEFDENGATTGIDNALRQPTDRGVLRDLSGRIVAYPVRGQVYIQSNGQKIILK